MGSNDHPWDMRPDESDNAFQAFATYRDLGAMRSIRAAGEQLGKNRVTLEQWSSKFDWPNRAKAYDKWMDQQATQAWADLRRQQVEQTNALANLLTLRAIQRVADTEGKAIPHDAIRAAEVAAKIQSQAMGDVKPDTQGEKESGLMIDAAELVKEMYRRAAEEGQSLD